MKQLIIESSSVCKGYALIEQLDKKFALNIYEASIAAAPAFWILAEVALEKQETVKEFLDSFKKSEVNFHFCACSEDKMQLRSALFGLASPQIQSYIGVVEGQSLVSLVAVLDDLLSSEDLQITDLQPARSAGGVSLAYFTGKQLVSASRLEEFKQKKRIVDYVLIDKPGEVFSAHFSL